MTEAIPQALLCEFAEAFELYDLDGNGVIPVARLELVLRTLGHAVNAARVESMQRRKLEQGETTMTFEEFLYLMQTGGTTTDFQEDTSRTRTAKLREALAVFDVTGTGAISVVNLRKALRDTMKESDVDDLVKKADPQGTGKVDCDLLASFMSQRT